VKTTLIWLCVLCLVLSASAALAVNLLQNPGFEDGTDPDAPPWQVYWGVSGQAVTDPAIAHSGNRCWLVNAEGDYPDVWLPAGRGTSGASS
jgi:hypothetical protein